MHGPVDQRARNHAHDHDQALAFLPGKDDLIARREGEVDVAGDQRLDVGPAAAGHGQFHVEAFLGKVALGLGEIDGRRRQRHHRQGHLHLARRLSVSGHGDRHDQHGERNEHTGSGFIRRRCHKGILQL
jgi:hypothetical protein